MKQKFKQTEIGMIPEDWGVKELNEVASYITEKINLDDMNITNFISTENMLPEKRGIILSSSLPKVGKVTQFKEGDILFSNIRTYFKKLWLAKFSGGCSNDVLVIRKKSVMNNKYLYYYLSQDKFLDFTVLTSKGTKMPRGDKTSIMSYEVNIPPIYEQSAIAKILSDIDSKIELNQQMNKTLEAVGQAIFKRWFIDFEFPNEKGKPYKSSGGEMVDSELGEIPKGWKTGKIYDICSSITSGGTPKRMENSFWGGKIAWFKTGELTDGPLLDSEEHISEDGLKNSACKLWDINTVLIALYASPTVGRLGLLKTKATSNQACSGLVAKKEIGYPFLFLNLFFKRDELNSFAVGAAQQNINQNVLKETKIIIPTNNVLLEFNVIQETIFNKITFLVFQNKSLIGIRDSLLPRLMSGKIRVPVEVRR